MKIIKYGGQEFELLDLVTRPIRGKGRVNQGIGPIVKWLGVVVLKGDITRLDVSQSHELDISGECVGTYYVGDSKDGVTTIIEEVKHD